MYEQREIFGLKTFMFFSALLIYREFQWNEFFFFEKIQIEFIAFFSFQIICESKFEKNYKTFFCDI